MPPLARHAAHFASRLLAVAPLLLATGACTCYRLGPWVQLEDKCYSVDIADDDAARARGLMFRDRLDGDHGMLFIHERNEPRSYWMKNTRIPLDILFFDDSLRLVSQQRNVPPCSAGDLCPPYLSAAPARFVLELNAGEAERLRLRDGATLRLGPDIHTAP